MDDFSTTHHVPGAFPETRIALPQKRERTTALPQIFVIPSSSLRPLDAPARSHMQDIEPPSSQGLVQFGESNDDIPLPIYPVASRHEECPTTQTMDFSLKATPYFDGKLGTTRADVGAVSDDCVDQPAVNAPSVQDHHDPRGNTSQDCASCSSLETQNKMLKQLVREAREERDEVLSSVGSLQRWRYQVRREPNLDDHGQDLEMAVENHTAHLPIDTLYHAARNKKINTLEAKVADLTEQLHNYEKVRNIVTGLQSIEEHIEEQIRTYDQELNTILAVNVPTPLEKSFSRLYMSAGLLKGYLYELHHLRRNSSTVRSGSGYEPVSARLEVLREKLRKEADRRRQAWALFTTTEALSPVATWFDYEEPIFDYAVIAEHSHEYQTTVAVEESEDDQMGSLTAFSDTVSDGPDELVTYYTPQHFHDYRTAVAFGKPEGSQMGLSTAYSDTSSDDFDELVTYYTPQASDDEGD
ncbi:hypothetical protein D6D29_09324 [Aureobasidium pullulans]|nr:hypothetical protein D6D29_09324 [Aureobasidium pullulans]